MGHRASKLQPRIVEVLGDDLNALNERALAEQFQYGDGQQVHLVIETLCELWRLIASKDISLDRLKRMCFGASTENTRDVLAGEEADSAGETSPAEPPADADSTELAELLAGPKRKHKGHGRNGAKDYPGAKKVEVSHETLKPGDVCPECKKGKIYDTRPGVLIRIVGQAPLQATVYELQKLRCNLCGVLFKTPAPQGIGEEKYDATSGTMIALLKYGSGLPFNRLQRLQGNLGIPLPAATQWDIVHAKAKLLAPAHEELIRQAAQGDVLHNDDTNNKILEFMGQRAKKAALAAAALDEETERDGCAADQQESNDKQSSRTGIFTSGIVSQCEGRQIAIFVTGRQHCGENLGDVLRRRAEELSPPIQMCDALSRNIPSEFKTLLANCLAHGRRNFVDVFKNFRDECRHVLLALKEIYANEHKARKQQLSPEARLHFHQTHSGPVMDELHEWLKRQIDERLMEPNSGLGQAVAYMLKHWTKLTLFLHEPGAPLDNNTAERALKKMILHRKNSYFFKTQNGADVGDLYLSLIYTCELNGVNAFDYLNELELHANEVASHPEQWMPWNYRANLKPIGTDSAVAGVPHEKASPESAAHLAAQT
jgi:transposase